MTGLSGRIFSGMIAFALLAIPASASAHERRDAKQQPMLSEKGEARTAPTANSSRIGFAQQPALHVPKAHLGRPITRTLLPPVPAVHRMPPVRSPGWTNIDYDEDEAPPPRRWYSHHEPDRDDYPLVCDEDGDDCRPATQYRCDEDGDDCEYYSEGYEPRYRTYRPEYDSAVPAYYRSRPDLLAERQQLIAQLDYAQAQFHAARASGDRKLSARWATYIKQLNHSLAALDTRAAGAADSIPGYMVPPPPVPPSPYPNPAVVYPYASYPNGAGYGVTPYGVSPISGVMNSLLGPMLGAGQIR